MRIAALGGAGVIGRRLVPRLRDAGHEVVVASRSARGEGSVRADFGSGEGLQEAIADADVIVHLVSDVFNQRKTDLAGTRNLLDLMTGQHLVYVSIVGVDRHPYRYYRTKLAAEGMIAGSGAEHTILRATQLHEFLAYFLAVLTKLPVAFVPKAWVFQPIDGGDVAIRLAELVESKPRGLQEGLAGPEIHRAEYLARSFMEAVGREKPLLGLPTFGPSSAAFEAGLHTNPAAATDGRTWEQFLSEFTLEGRPPY